MTEPEAARPERTAPEAPKPGADTASSNGAPQGPSSSTPSDGNPGSSGGSGGGPGSSGGGNRRRRGSRGGRNRNRSGGGSGPSGSGATTDASGTEQAPSGDGSGTPARAEGPSRSGGSGGGGRGGGRRGGEAPSADTAPDDRPELPDRHRENKPSAEAADKALVRKPQIGDSMPAPPTPAAGPAKGGSSGEGGGSSSKRRRRRGGRGRGSGSGGGQGGPSGQGQQQGGGKGKGRNQPVTAVTDDDPVELDEETLEKRRGRERKGKATGRYSMAVHVQERATQISVLEGRSLLEHYVSYPADDVSQIHGNIYLGKVQNVLPGMEAAFVDIGTPKNAVLYRGDTRYDPEDLDDKGGSNLRIEQILKPRQTILCQVTKNPIGAKGARLTQEVSLPGRFVVLVPNSTTYGISKRLPDNERKRLRSILDKVRPKGHGLIVRTAAEGVLAEEIERDVARLASQWEQIEALAKRSQAPTLLYREPDMAVRVIREEFNKDYRKVVIDDEALFTEVRDYVRSISPELADRVELYDPAAEGLPIVEKFHVHEQLHKALDRKVWLPSGGSLIIERTEALTVIDVNTGKNVGSKSLEETVFKNNLEAAVEVARQLRLRDIGGIIVIDFIDMEVKANRAQVIQTFREALSRDKTRTQVFDISELGLVEMTRKRIGEGLLESLSTACPTCEGRGMVFDKELIGD